MAVVGNNSSLAVIVPVADKVVVSVVLICEIVVQVGVGKEVRVRIANVCQVSAAVCIED